MSEIETLLGLVTAAGIERAWPANGVPTKLAPRDYPYVVVSASRMAPDTRRLDGGGNNPRRFVVQIFSRNAEGIEDFVDIVLGAFDCAFLPFPGEPQCRVEITTPPYRDADDQGVLGVTHTYRY